MPGLIAEPTLTKGQQQQLDQVVEAFTTSDKQLSSTFRQIHRELATNHTWFQQGEQQTVDNANPVNCCNKKPHGTALGMAIDASGKRIRISSTRFVEVDGGKQTTSESVATQVFIPSAKARENVSEFFKFVAFCIREFINNHGLLAEKSTTSVNGATRKVNGEFECLPLGVSIGLPISTAVEESRSLLGHDKILPAKTRLYCNVAEISKEDSLDLGNSDVARYLHDAILCNHLPVRIASVANNVVNSLVAAQFNDKTTRVAASFNHGVNAAYLKRAPNDSADALDNSDVAINTEIGRFGSTEASLSALPLTMWDNRIDRESKHPGMRRFEKLVADQYLGEIVRNLITDFMDRQLLFSSNCEAAKISDPYSFHTAYMAPIMEDTSLDLSAVGNLFATEFGIATSLGNRQIIRTFCDCVASRASRLSGAMLAALVLKSSDYALAKRCTVALYGALFDVNAMIYNDTVATMQRLMADYSSRNGEDAEAVEVRASIQSRFIDLVGASINAASA
ncbi:Hexokinase-3 [Coemansia sp. RSA 1200]|nr:Hexokinase-3 [Coemansia sp. RSA 1200]